MYKIFADTKKRVIFVEYLKRIRYLILKKMATFTSMMNQPKEKQELVINKDYGFVFGLDKEKKQHMIYNGGINWTAIEGERTMTIDCQKTTDKVNEYINR